LGGLGVSDGRPSKSSSRQTGCPEGAQGARRSWADGTAGASGGRRGMTGSQGGRSGDREPGDPCRPRVRPVLTRARGGDRRATSLARFRQPVFRRFRFRPGLWGVCSLSPGRGSSLSAPSAPRGTRRASGRLRVPRWSTLPFPLPPPAVRLGGGMRKGGSGGEGEGGGWTFPRGGRCLRPSPPSLPPLWAPVALRAPFQEGARGILPRPYLPDVVFPSPPSPPRVAPSAAVVGASIAVVVGRIFLRNWIDDRNRFI
jgi:hypothetical protein